MTRTYIDNYVRAIDNPLPELKATFESEFELLKRHSYDTSIVLDVGCGAGRPANELSKYVRSVYCVDNDPAMILLANKRCQLRNNVRIMLDDALKLSISDCNFDLTYATYNLLGSMDKSDRQEAICEMKRVTKERRTIINIGWNNNVDTTEFLKQYYPSIGIDIIKSDKFKTITSKGEFDRISKDELGEYYESAELHNIKFVEVGPLWHAIIGTK